MTLLSTLVPVLCGAMMATGNTQAPAPGPLRQAIAREAARRVLDPPNAPAPQSDWARVTALLGTEVTIETAGGPPATRTIVAADDARLTTLNLTSPVFPAKARRALLRMAGRFPPQIAAMTGTVDLEDESVLLTPDGLFVDGRKVADLREVVETVDRKDVREIAIHRRRGSIAGAVLGAGAGFALGMGASIRLAFKQCGSSCADEKFLIGLSLIGLPVAGGILGYRAGGIHDVRTIVYRNQQP